MTRFLIAGSGSTCGKTTVVCALLSAYRARGLSIAAFKCGPDYIDPMFHRQVTGVPTYNLDAFFYEEDALCAHIARHGGTDISLIEGAMGYYDGLASTDRASSYDVAKKTKTPVVLVLNAKHTGNSLGAVIEGFKNHRSDSNIVGVIWNCLHEARYADMKAVAERAGVECYGYLPFDKENSIESRHLGLVTAGEIAGLKEKLDRLGTLAEKTIDLDGLLALAGTAAPLEKADTLFEDEPKVRVAVARDDAFCFLYTETLDALRGAGCELVYFSPLKDERLPEGVSGLYLCGGYPELYAEALSRNVTMLASIAEAIAQGMATIAECGGFMYLHKTLGEHTLVGAIDADTYKTERLQRFGYITLEAKADNLLVPAGGRILAHEFHYWDSTDAGAGFCAHKAGRGTVYDCAHASQSLYAGFPHLALTPQMAKRFVEKMEIYQRHNG